MLSVLALAATMVVGQPQRPQLVTLPLAASSGQPQPTLSAWNSVVAELDRLADRVGVGVDLQRARHEFLVGPAREQARDCGRDIDCLAEIGAALGADYVVIGVVSRRVALLALRVDDRAVLAKARSPQAGSIDERAQRSARRLARRLAHALGQPEAPPARATRRPAPPSEPAAPPPRTTGLLYIHRDQLSGVRSLTLDGEPVAYTGEGFVSWPAASGRHTLRAIHVDGRTLEQPVFLEPGQTTEVELRFAVPPLAASPAATAPPEVATAADTRDEDDVTGTWWFWTVVGAAVLAGATTAVALTPGTKGGPTPPTETGTVRGTY